MIRGALRKAIACRLVYIKDLAVYYLFVSVRGLILRLPVEFIEGKRVIAYIELFAELNKR